MTTQLSEAKFENTFGSKWIDVTDTAEPSVNIWDYVGDLVEQAAIDKYVYENRLVEVVYRNETLTFDHVLLPTDNKNIFVTIVVDLINNEILGHIELNLNEKYGLLE